MELFRLKRCNPVVMYRDELEKLGFSPHGDVYLTFRIDEKIDKNQLSFDDEFVKRIKGTTMPFIISLHKL